MGAYFVWFFNFSLGCPLQVSILLSLILCAISGVLIESLFYHYLIRKKASPLLLLLTSLGIYIFIQNVISISFGDDTKIIRTDTVQEGIRILDARISVIQIVMIILSIVVSTMLTLFLKKTKIGHSIRAVAEDQVLANISGINSNGIILCVFAIGSALVGLIGIFVAIDIDMTPTMGMNALMMGVVATIIGGVNNISGIVLGALLLSTAQNLGVWYIGSQWQDAIAFVILVLFLLFKPEGFFGNKFRSSTV